MDDWRMGNWRTFPIPEPDDKFSVVLVNRYNNIVRETAKYFKNVKDAYDYYKMITRQTPKQDAVMFRKPQHTGEPWIRVRTSINESQLQRKGLLKRERESIKKVLNEAAFSPNHPANTINNTIWANYDLPWNKVDDTPEQYKGIWYITVDFFDYTEHMGTVEIDRQFKSLEDCLNYAQNISIYEVEKLCNEEITDEGFSSISLNIMCQCDKGNYEVANTRMYMPKE